MEPVSTPPVEAAPRSPADGSEVEALRRELERARALASKDRGLLAGLLEHSPHGIIVCDAQGGLVLQNRAAERIWAGSATATNVEGWRKYRAFHPDGRPFAPQDWAMAKSLETRRVVEAEEFHILRFDDSEGHLLGSSAPILSPEGELEGALSIFVDITSLKRSEAEASRLEEDLGTKVRNLEAIARQASLLHDLSAAITRAETVQEIADVLTAQGRELFGASGSLVFLLDADRRLLDLVSSGNVAPSRAAQYQSLELASELPLPAAVRTGRPAWFTSRRELLAAFPHLAGVQLDGAPLEGLIAIPLRDTRAVIGGLALTYYGAAPEVDEIRRGFFLTVAAQCGLAVERARTMQSERRALEAERAALEAERRANAELERQRQRLALLSQAAETLSSSLSSRHALGELAKLVVPTLADWCAIDELAPDGQIRRLAVHHRDPAKVALAERLHEEYPPRPEDEHGVPRVLRTGDAEWVAELPDEILVAMARDAEHLALARSLGLRSYAVVPIKARGRTLGALSLVTEGDRRLTEDDLRFGEELARRAALALENARLYEAAEAARAHLHGLFMEAPAAISIGRGREHRYELANEPYQRLVGRGPLVGRTAEEAFAAGAGTGFREAALRVFDTGETFVGSELPLHPGTDDGGSREPRYFNVVHQATRDARGRVDGVATFAFDVSDQVRARRRVEALATEVARNELRMRGLVDATAAIVWTATAEGQIVEVSPSWLAFTGQTASEYADGGFLEAIHPEDRAATMQSWASAVSDAAPYAAEYRLRRAGGGYAHTLARAVPVRGPEGQVLEYVGCNIDVTGLRQAEESARQHADTLRTLNDLGRVIAAELDTQKVVQAVTDAATSLTGAQFGAFFYNVLDARGASYMLYTLSGVSREHFSRFPMPRATAVFAPTFRAEGVVRSADITQDPRFGKNAPHHGMPEGHLPVRSYLAVPVVSRTGAVIGGIFLGHAATGVFTDRHEALVSGLAAQAAVAMDNARLFGDAQRLIKALETTNRELDQFAYVASHDLRAPLRAIGSLSEWLEEDLGPALPEDGRRQMELLRGRVRRMEALIQGILDFSRAARLPDKREEVDVAGVLSEVLDMLAPKPPAQVTVGAGLPRLHTHRVALQQVLMNLVGNALKHAGRPDARVHVEAREDAEHWEFRVVDNGPGIAPEFHERIWGLFQTLEPRDKVESTGIGLAVVRKIVEGRGGRAWIESTSGQGATFAFTWPKREDRTT